jgi:hypothetical protein
MPLVAPTAAADDERKCHRDIQRFRSAPGASAYVEGPTTYSWKWDRHDISRAGSAALRREDRSAGAVGRIVPRPGHDVLRVGDDLPVLEVDHRLLCIV